MDQRTRHSRPMKIWERGSVYEPNLFTPMASGRCGMWPARTSTTTWFMAMPRATMGGPVGASTIFAPAEMKMFDFCVCPGRQI